MVIAETQSDSIDSISRSAYFHCCPVSRELTLAL